MDTYHSIKKRRSVRSYKDKKVKHSDICKVLEAGHNAPSSGNLQPWRFLVIQDHPKKEDLCRCCLNQLWMQEAPVWVVVCSEGDMTEKQYKKGKRFVTQSCAAVIQNMLLQATELGLGSCWVSVTNAQKFKNNLRIPDYVNVEGVVTLGYAAEKPKEDRKKLEIVTFFDQYGKKERDSSLFPLAKHLKKLRR